MKSLLLASMLAAITIFSSPLATTVVGKHPVQNPSIEKVYVIGLSESYTIRGMYRNDFNNYFFLMGWSYNPNSKRTSFDTSNIR